MSGKPKICVVGSLNVDFVTKTPRVPGPGETLTATSLTVHAGGKGANQAVACGRAAFTSRDSQDVVVEMIGAVGANDPYYASLLKPTLEKSGVSIRGVRELEGVQTGTATILVDEGANGENRIMFVPGANAHVLDAEDVFRNQLLQHGSPEVVVMQGETPRETVLELLRKLNSHGTDGQRAGPHVIFNPAPMFPQGIPSDALQSLPVLVVNETEFGQLIQSNAELSKGSLEQKGVLTNETTLIELTNVIHAELKITIIIVTLGSSGVFYSHVSKNDLKSKAHGLLPATKVEKVVDTTAAGDTFVGCFAAAVARHLFHSKTLDDFDVKEATTNANQAAGKCIQRVGAMDSIPFGYE
jgi:ribokinase